MRSLMNMPMGFFEGKSGGRMRKVIDENASETHAFIAHVLPDLMGSIVAPLVVLVMIFVFDYRLGIACIIPIILAILVIASMMDPRTNDFQRRYLLALEEMSEEAVEYVRGIPVVKVFQQTIYSFKRFHQSIISYRDLVTRYTGRLRARMILYQMFIHAIPYVLIPTAILIVRHDGDYRRYAPLPPASTGAHDEHHEGDEPTVYALQRRRGDHPSGGPYPVGYSARGARGQLHTTAL